MERVREKLHSRTGASLLIALLFFLVAAMVSAVIISAAATATKTVKTRRDNQQAYLTCSSAAEYLRDLLLGKEGYQVVLKHNRTVDSDGKDYRPLGVCPSGYREFDIDENTDISLNGYEINPGHNTDSSSTVLHIEFILPTDFVYKSPIFEIILRVNSESDKVSSNMSISF